MSQAVFGYFLPRQKVAKKAESVIAGPPALFACPACRGYFSRRSIGLLRRIPLGLVLSKSNKETGTALPPCIILIEQSGRSLQDYMEIASSRLRRIRNDRIKFFFPFSFIIFHICTASCRLLTAYCPMSSPPLSVLPGNNNPPDGGCIPVIRVVAVDIIGAVCNDTVRSAAPHRRSDHHGDGTRFRCLYHSGS